MAIAFWYLLLLRIIYLYLFNVNSENTKNRYTQIKYIYKIINKSSVNNKVKKIYMTKQASLHELMSIECDINNHD